MKSYFMSKDEIIDRVVKPTLSAVFTSYDDVDCEAVFGDCYKYNAFKGCYNFDVSLEEFWDSVATHRS